jgi:hypothetical protein
MRHLGWSPKVAAVHSAMLAAGHFLPRIRCVLLLPACIRMFALRIDDSARFDELVRLLTHQDLVSQNSGGQESIGQEGGPSPDQVEKEQTNEGSKMLAIAQGVQRVRSVMQELETVESMLCIEDALQELKEEIRELVVCHESFQMDLLELSVPSILVYEMECEDRPEIVNEDSDQDMYEYKSNGLLHQVFESMLNFEYGETAKQVELKNSIKQLMTAPKFLECLSNLEVKGEPVGGLSIEEREMVVLAREKVNKC